MPSLHSTSSGEDTYDLVLQGEIGLLGHSLVAPPNPFRQLHVP